MKNKCFLCASALLASFSVVSCGSNSESSVIESINHGTVTSLSVVTNPTKLSYDSGELFDPTGMVINATYEDNYIEENVEYHVVGASTPLTTSANYVTIRYKEGEVDIKITVSFAGNNEKYSVENTPVLDNRPLEGKTMFWLGSSVTYGACSEGEATCDYIAKRQNATSIKWAVSGTTLLDSDSGLSTDPGVDESLNGKSYVYRLDNYIAKEDCVKNVDYFCLQLSTNDMYKSARFGAVTDADVKDINSFNKTTTFGAIEYIVAKAKETWDCKVVIWSNSYFQNNNYKKMVDATKEIASKWNIEFLNLYEDEEFNKIGDANKALYMKDNIHPTKAGYREWWVPKFEECLASIK